MIRTALVTQLSLAIFACTGEAAKGPLAQTSDAKPTAPAAEAKPGDGGGAKADDPIAKAADTTNAPPPNEDPRFPGGGADFGDSETDEPSEAELAIVPIAPVAHEAPWRLVASPAEPLALAAMNAGVIGKSSSGWVQLGAGGQLEPVAFDREPKLTLCGVWPSDAWFIDERTREADHFEHTEIRMMKLRGGKRWVPQQYIGVPEQWFEPGDEENPLDVRIGQRSGMLVWDREIGAVSRVAGKHSDLHIGKDRRGVIDYVETHSGRVYVLMYDEAGIHARTLCEEEVECVEHSAKLPAGKWTFAGQVARGKNSVTVAAIDEGRDRLLHYDGKPERWLLEDLATTGSPARMWGTSDGGMWTLAGETLRHRDPSGKWRDVALPEGMSGPSVALTEDRKELWISGMVDGSAKVFATHAAAQRPPG